MRKIALTLAFASVISMTVLPVTASFAASPDTKVRQHVYRGEIVALMEKHAVKLKVRHPALYEKLVNSGGSPPNLTAAEIAIVAPMTMETLRTIKAGQVTNQPAANPNVPQVPVNKAAPTPLEVTACFGTVAGLFALPHPWSYIAAGGVFVFCFIKYVLGAGAQSALDDWFAGLFKKSS